MALPRRYAKKHAKATRHRLNASNTTPSAPSPRCLKPCTLLGLPDNLVVEIAGRLRAQKKLLGKVFGPGLLPWLIGGLATPS